MKYEFTGADPIDHFHLGRIEPGDVVEFDDHPAGPWRATRKRTTTTAEPASDEPDTDEEG